MRKGAKHGPKEDRLRIESDWKVAMRQSLKKKKRTDGWPK